LFPLLPALFSDKNLLRNKVANLVLPPPVTELVNGISNGPGGISFLGQIKWFLLYNGTSRLGQALRITTIVGG
jgi:hypothetical protein